MKGSQRPRQSGGGVEEVALSEAYLRAGGHHAETIIVQAARFEIHEAKALAQDRQGSLAGGGGHGTVQIGLGITSRPQTAAADWNRPAAFPL